MFKDPNPTGSSADKGPFAEAKTQPLTDLNWGLAIREEYRALLHATTAHHGINLTPAQYDAFMSMFLTPQNPKDGRWLPSPTNRIDLLQDIGRSKGLELNQHEVTYLLVCQLAGKLPQPLTNKHWDALRTHLQTHASHRANHQPVTEQSVFIKVAPYPQTSR